MRVLYGDDPSQFADLWLPDGDGRHRVVVLIHGGFWRTGYCLDLMDALARSLVDAGIAAWNIEYRRVGGPSDGGSGGGWPTTFDDAAAAVDHLAALPDELRHRLDLTNVATVGHSAGGHLATWLAARTRLPAGAPWANPTVVPTVAISQAGVLDLARGIADDLGDRACLGVLADPASTADLEPHEIDRRVALASPAELVPLDARIVAIHGALDDRVPIDQSTGFIDVALAAASDASLVTLEGADHFVHINPESAAWAAVLDALPEHRSARQRRLT